MKPAAMTIQSSICYSGISRSTVYNKIKDGTLKTCKVGRRTLILTTSIDAMLGIDVRSEAVA